MTDTLTDKMTIGQTATKTQVMTDFMTVTKLNTVVQPTTFTSIWVSTNVIDKVCRI